MNDIKSLIENVRFDMLAALEDETAVLMATIVSLQATVIELKTNNEELEKKYQELRLEMQDMKLGCLIEISSQLEERMQRRSNLIISGVPEPPETSFSSDKTSCCEILQEIGFDSNCIAEVSRIEKPRSDRARFP